MEFHLTVKIHFITILNSTYQRECCGLLREIRRLRRISFQQYDPNGKGELVQYYFKKMKCTYMMNGNKNIILNQCRPKFLSPGTYKQLDYETHVIESIIFYVFLPAFHFSIFIHSCMATNRVSPLVGNLTCPNNERKCLIHLFTVTRRAGFPFALLG